MQDDHTPATVVRRPITIRLLTLLSNKYVIAPTIVIITPNTNKDIQTNMFTRFLSAKAVVVYLTGVTVGTVILVNAPDSAGLRIKVISLPSEPCGN